MSEPSKSIDAYRAKRDFGKTPEPPPEEARKDAPSHAFVVHRHEARRLHYDLRLEMEGVLKSWAIPRGFSYDPTVKRLGVRTEDHPLAYETFEGVIPKGEYGGGTMTIWDRGRYEILETDDGPAAVEAGKLEIRLRGRKLRGEWHLVKTRSDKEEHAWILFKARDLYARGETEKQPFFDLARAVDAPLFETVVPMAPGAERAAFSDPAFLFELDFDGRRAAARKEGDAVLIRAADGEDLTVALPELVEDVRRLRAENAWIDGVLVVLDDLQRPSKQRLEARLRGENEETVVYYAFDLLYYEEWDVRPLTLVERKEILGTLPVPGLARFLFVDHVQGRGEEFCDVARSAGLDGVIAKRGESLYTEGPSNDWCRVPLERATEPREDVVTALRSRKPATRKINFTNLDKLLWPEDGITKGELIRYYDRVAETLLPYLHERPVHMLRYPDGIHGKSFYQKNAPAHMPDWVVTESIESGSREEAIHYIICNDRDTLLVMANLASIDMHPWLSRRSSRETPDWAVFDLDAKKSPFPDVVRIARTLGKVLRGIGLRPYLKTSGATGLHIYVPVVPEYTYNQTKGFCELLAHHVAAEHKDIATIERNPARRGRRVYVDFLQNRRGQTVVPPYAVRPRPQAPVSTPLHWDELDGDLQPTHFTLRNILERLGREGDLFHGALTDKQHLRPAIDAFQRTYTGG